MLDWIAGSSFEQRWNGLKGLWGDALSSPEWWALTIVSALHFSVDGAVTQTVIQNEVGALHNKIGAPTHWIEKAAKGEGGIIFPRPSKYQQCNQSNAW